MMAGLTNGLCPEQRGEIKFLLDEDVEPCEILFIMKNCMVLVVCLGQAFISG